jgi:hypothetical protein
MYISSIILSSSVVCALNIVHDVYGFCTVLYIRNISNMNRILCIRIFSTRILEALGQTSAWRPAIMTGPLVFFLSPKQMLAYCLNLGYGLFLPYPFHFIILQLSYCVVANYTT